MFGRFSQLPIIAMCKAKQGGLDGCRGEESDLVRLERLHGANSNLSDPVLRTSSNLSTVMQHWKPIPQEVVHSHFIWLSCDPDARFLLIGQPKSRVKMGLSGNQDFVWVQQLSHFFHADISAARRQGWQCGTSTMRQCMCLFAHKCLQNPG